MAALTDPVVIDTKALAKPVGQSVHVRIGGVVYEAHCPKDSVFLKFKESADDNDGYATIMRCFEGMIGLEGADEVRAMVEDPGNREVSLSSLSQMLTWLLEDKDGPQWRKAIEESVKELGSGETPRTVPTRKAAAAPRTTKRAPARRR